MSICYLPIRLFILLLLLLVLNMQTCGDEIDAEKLSDCGGKYCSFDSDCNIKNFCCPKSRKCIQIGLFDPCESNNQCPDDSKCHHILFRCYPLKSNTHSTHEMSLEWDVVDGKVCRTDNHCHRDSYCNGNGECIPLPILSQRCSESNGKCKRPFICSSKDKTCRMPCWTNFDCQQNYKWWNEASTISKEGRLLTSHKRLDLPGSTQHDLFPMEEGNQGYCCEGENESFLPLNNCHDSIGYDWCNSEGNYCDLVPGSTSYKLIFLALIPLILVLGIFIICKMINKKSRNRQRPPSESDNTRIFSNEEKNLHSK